MQVGLVPLNRIPFSEAKSNLKGLEYAAAGIPFIATPTEEYRILAEAGVGRLASTPDEWRDHARELLDVDVRREEADRQRRIVQEQFDISTKGSEWDTAISG
jgi:glycosyltransferase involved in cell wall biosynthesis